MSRRLSVRLSAVFAFVSVSLSLFLLAATPLHAQEGATHAGCQAIACIDVAADRDCPVHWVSLPPGQPEIPVRSAEDVAAAFPHVVRVTKKFPNDEGICASYTWDPVQGICWGESPECTVPEPGAEECGSACFCVRPGEGVEIEQDPPVPFQLYGTDGSVEWTLQPNRFFLVAVPIGVTGLHAHDLFKAFDECTIDHVSKLACDGSEIEWSPRVGPENDFPLTPGEAYGVWTADVDCVARGHLDPRPTHVPRACNGTEYVVTGVGNGEGYGWAVDSAYLRPYHEPQDPEAEDPLAPGAGPGAPADAEVRALVEDINAQRSDMVAAQVDRSSPAGDRLCVIGMPEHPVLWITPPGLPPEEGCDVNDTWSCDLEGTTIRMAGIPAPVLWLDHTLVHWTDVADTYDVVYGRIQPLREEFGFEAATEGCLEDGTRALATSHEWLEPEPGEDAFWFLARAANEWDQAPYDHGGEPGLVVSREEGIRASGNDCP